MLAMGKIAVTGEAIRAYVVALRKLRAQQVRKRYSQEAVGAVAGMTKRAWIDYELGRTEGLRDTALLSVWQYLSGSFDHLRELADKQATAADGRRLAEQRLIEETGKSVAALRQRMSAAEFDRFVDDLEDALSRHVSDIPRLVEVLQRYRVPPPSESPPD